MSLYVIGDTHLSFGTDKPMDIFGGWNDYTERLKNNWQRLVNENDTVVINGDISWAMSLDEAFRDFEFLNSLNGTKIILKGNHDFWWSTKTKICIIMHTVSVSFPLQGAGAGFLTMRQTARLWHGSAQE